MRLVFPEGKTGVDQHTYVFNRPLRFYFRATDQDPLSLYFRLVGSKLPACYSQPGL